MTELAAVRRRLFRTVGPSASSGTSQIYQVKVGGRVVQFSERLGLLNG